MRRAIADNERVLALFVSIEDETLTMIAELSGGDARRAERSGACGDDDAQMKTDPSH